MTSSGSRQRRDGERRPSDRRDRDDRNDRRDYQPDDDQQRRGDIDLQESDSLTALKAILGKVAGLLTGLKLTQDECISLVEHLYGSVLDMDLKLAGETDDKRKAAILAHVQNTNIARNGAKLVVEYPKMDAPAAPLDAPAAAEPAPAPEPVAAAEPAPAVETEPELVATPTPAPAPETEPEPVAEPTPAAEPDEA